MNILLSFFFIFIAILSFKTIISKKVVKLNVALHAQVHPSDNKIVGSVITTDGLYTAFSKRTEVGHVEIFYPFSYGTLFLKKWDFVIIEGWFPMINEFIELVRNHQSNVIIIYYCLDPTYPDIEYTFKLDVNGYMTNSEALNNELGKLAPSIFLMLAADEDKMKPMPNITREYGAVYVGAGGLMLEYKSALLPMLESSLPQGLRLHGSHWSDLLSDQNYTNIYTLWLII